MIWKIVTSFIFLYSLASHVYVSAECQSAWNNEPCPSNMGEVYRDVDRYNQGVTRQCCTKDILNDQIKEASSECRQTDCLSATLEDTCDWLDYRYIKNTQLEYEQFLHDTCQHPHHTSNSEEIGKVALCCLKDSADSYVLSTTGAEPHEFPHQAQVRIDYGSGMSFCGGTIYNSRWILTAGHCMVERGGDDKVTADIKVVLGTNIANGENEIEYKVVRAITHKEFGFLKTSKDYQERMAMGLSERMINDISLLELEKDIQFSENVKALQIAEADFDHTKYSDIGLIVGWGVTELGKGSDFLHKANVPFREECLKFYYGPTPKKYNDRVICASGITKDKFSIAGGQGDSGGPLVCSDWDGHPRLCGITSMGGNKVACVKKLDEDSCPPPAYTKVAYYRDWIIRHAGEQDPKQFFRGYLYGRKVNSGTRYFQVHITSKDGKSCGGTLIAPDVVLTAGQCVSDGAGKQYEDLKITGRFNGNGNEYGVVAVKLLPGFKRSGPKIDLKKQGNRVIQTDNYYINDLALLKLDSDALGFTREIKTLPRLPNRNEQFENGVELAFLRNNSTEEEMRSREYKLLKRSECQRRLNRLKYAGFNFTIGENMLCGVENYSAGSTCDRELGGPLLCRDKSDNDVICGVQIFRLCEFALPNGFMNVALYSDWIKKELENFE